MEKLFIPIIQGTSRTGNATEQVATLVNNLAQEFGFDTLVVRPEQFATPFTVDSGAELDAWCKIAQRADAFIVVTPEYNHSYPGELKLLLDKAYKEYNHKPIGMVAVSSGAMGGVRVLESLLPVFNALKLVTLRDGVYCTSVHSRFEDGQPTPEGREWFADRLQSMFTELQAYGDGMKPIRKQLATT